MRDIKRVSERVFGSYERGTTVEISTARSQREEQERGGRGVVAVGAIRCLEPQVVANHLLGLKNFKLRVDMGLCLHRLEPTTGPRGIDGYEVNSRIFIIDISRLFATFADYRTVLVKYRPDDRPRDAEHSLYIII